MDTALVMQQQQEEQVVERGEWRWLCLFVGLAKRSVLFGQDLFQFR
jgi:hypothetical protein